MLENKERTETKIFLRQGARPAGNTQAPVPGCGDLGKAESSSACGAGTELVTIGGGNQEDQEGMRLHPGLWAAPRNSWPVPGMPPSALPVLAPLVLPRAP